MPVMFCQDRSSAATCNATRFKNTASSSSATQASVEDCQEGQGGAPLVVLRSPALHGLPSGSSLGSLTIHHTGICCTLTKAALFL